MPYFELEKGKTEFPPAYFADLDGLLAVGGDMNEEVLLKAYNSGIFYWHHPMKHIRWWSPEPRMVIQLPYEITENELLSDRLNIVKTLDFDTLLRHLQSVFNQEEAMNQRWLPERMYRIFSQLNQQKLIKAYEIRENDDLIGGLFGVAIGKIFFGEYIWAPDHEAVDLAVKQLLHDLNSEGYKLVDMQKETFRSQGITYDEMSRLSYVDYCKQNAEQHGF